MFGQSDWPKPTLNKQLMWVYAHNKAHEAKYPASARYINLKVLGRLYFKNFNRVDPSSFVQIHHFNRIIQYKSDLERIIDNKYSIVHPTQANTQNTVLSWDAKSVCSYSSSRLSVACSLFEDRYNSIFVNALGTDEEIFDSIDSSRSAGFPWNTMGYYDKKTLFQEKHWTDFMQLDPSLIPKVKVYWTVSGKVEPKLKEDIVQNKIRLFQVAPTHYLYYQHKFGLRSSQKLKMFEWSAYGFNPYNGGYNTLAHKLLTKPIRFCYDISGWDKFLPIMNDLYQSIRLMLGLPPELGDLWEWVRENVCEAKLLLPDGTIVEKNYGNPSGSGTTTRDNILCHIIITFYNLLEAHLEETGFEANPTLLFEQVINLYGDDNVASVDYEFRLMADYDWMNAQFNKFGMKLKFLNTTQDADLSNLSFLGAHFHLEHGIYYPKYDETRLAFSMINAEQKIGLSQYTSRVFSLYLMSYKSKHFPLFQACYNALRASIQKQEYLTNDPSVKAFCLTSIQDREIEGFYSGRESNLDILKFFYSKDEDHSGGGWYKSDLLLNIIPQSKMSNQKQQNLLALALKKNVISKAGMEWLTVVTDPWHDTPADFSGMPDQTIGKSLAFSITKEIQLTKPAVLPAGNWSVRIANHPFLNTHKGVVGISNGNIAIPNVPNIAVDSFPVQVDYAQDGLPFGYGAVATGLHTGVELDSSILEGSVRCVGMGIEACNTTGALYQQGLCTIATMPQPDPLAFAGYVGIANGVVNALSTTMSMYPVRGIPSDLSEMVLYKDCAQWHAKEGAYVPVKVKTDRPSGMPDPSQPLIYAGKDPAIINLANIASVVPLTVGATLPGNTTSFQAPTQLSAHFNAESSVIMFTGLSDQTSITLRVRFLIERFPNDSEPALIPLTKQSAKYDPTALEVYSKWCARSPAGCMFTENPSGEWWAKTLSSLGSIIGPLIMAIPHPIAKAAGGAISVGSPILQDWAESQKSQRKIKNVKRIENGKTAKNSKGRPKKKKNPDWESQSGMGNLVTKS